MLAGPDLSEENHKLSLSFSLVGDCNQYMYQAFLLPWADLISWVIITIYGTTRYQFINTRLVYFCSVAAHFT